MKYTVEQINNAAASNVEQLILGEEERYHNKLRELAKVIKNDANSRIIMLAGPSGSGKTTSASLLSGYLTELGTPTQVVSLDDFYLEWEKQPQNADGTPDFESVYGLDVNEINHCFEELVASEQSFMPIYDFKRSCRAAERKNISVKGGGAVIIEGLHALNPILYESIPREKIFKIYISVSSEVYDNDTEVIAGGRIRFLRRLLRDETHRNSTTERTLELWKKVMFGEAKYLVPFKNSADFKIDTFHSYELGVYRQRAERMLNSVSKLSAHYEFSQRVLKGIKEFGEIPVSFVPQKSLLREFV